VAFCTFRPSTHVRVILPVALSFLPSGRIELKVTIEAFGTEHKHKIIQALADKGYDPQITTTNV
ncbi:MAG: hypothetical protein IKI86_03685, partial [Firmicutes bacterium]|nr:hypothetical protein [Bacillota bacterium]